MFLPVKAMMNSGKRLRFKIFFFRPEYSIHDPLHCLDITTQPNEPDQLLKEVKFPRFSEKNPD